MSLNSSTNTLKFTNKNKYYLVILLGLFALMTLNLLVASEQITALDQAISEFIFSWRGTRMTQFFKGLTKFFNPIPVTILVSIVGIWAYYRSSHQKLISLWFILTIATGGLLLNPLAKNLIQRNRPPIDVRLITETTYSYPSGHAFIATLTLSCICLLIETLVPLKARQCFYLRLIVCGFIVLIMVSRVYLGVHYFTDVIAGCLLALIWLNTTRWIITNKQ